MKLPSADTVEVEVDKITGYLLSPSHPVGRFKARVFAAVGFDETNAEAFILEIRRVAAEGEVTKTEETKFGRKYTVPGELRGPSGALPVLTAWFQEAGASGVRLVTVRPR